MTERGEVADRGAEIDVRSERKTGENDEENDTEMVQMHHRGTHGLVHYLQARLELVVLEESEDAEQD